MSYVQPHHLQHLQNHHKRASNDVSATITDEHLATLLVDKRWRYLRFSHHPRTKWYDDLDDFRWRCLLSGIDADTFSVSMTHLRSAATQVWPFIVRNAREFEFQMCSRLLHLVTRYHLIGRYVVALARRASSNLSVSPTSPTSTSSSPSSSLSTTWLKPLHAIWQTPASASNIEIPLGLCIHCIAVCSTSEKLVAGAANKVLLVHTETTLVRELIGHKCDVTAVALSPDGTRVVSGSADGEVRVWDARTGHAVAEAVSEHHMPVSHVTVCRTGRFFVSGSADCVCVWNTNAVTLAAVPLRLRDAPRVAAMNNPMRFQHISPLRGVAISATGRRVLYATTNFNQMSTATTTTAGEMPVTRSDSGGSGRSRDSASSGCTNGSGSRSGSVCGSRSESMSDLSQQGQRVMVFDVGKADPPAMVYTNEHGVNVPARAFLGSTLTGIAIVRVGFAVVKLIDLESMQTLRTLRNVPGWFTYASCTLFNTVIRKSFENVRSNGSLGKTHDSNGDDEDDDDDDDINDGEMLFSGWSRDDDVAIWRTKHGTSLGDGYRLSMSGMGDRRRIANCVCVSSDARHVYTGSADGVLRIWDAKPGRTVSLRFNSNGCNNNNNNNNNIGGTSNGELYTWVRVCPYGRRIATVARDGKLCMWGFHDGKRLYDEEGPEDMVTAMSFSRDGSCIVLGTSGGNVCLWDPGRDSVHEVSWCDGRFISDVRTDERMGKIWDDVIYVKSRFYASAWSITNAQTLQLVDSWERQDDFEEDSDDDGEHEEDDILGMYGRDHIGMAAHYDGLASEAGDRERDDGIRRTKIVVSGRTVSVMPGGHVLATLPAEVNGSNAWHLNEEHGAFVAALRDGTIVRCQF